MKATVNHDLCIGCGVCVGIAPNVFRLNNDGKAECYKDGTEAEISESIDGCPVFAIEEEE